MILQVALLFPGQGAQYVGMGKLLAKEFPIARKTFEEADEVLGWKISELCFQGPQTEVTKTANSQPAILVTSIATWRVFQQELGNRMEIGMAAGLSLGEYSALVAAESLSFADGVKVVRIRGELMEKAAQENSGTMASLIGLEEAVVAEICRQSGAEIANLNSPEQVVISGTHEDVQKASELATLKGAKRIIPLEVSGPFHSRWMAPAQEGLRAALEKIQIHPPRFPVVHNVTARSSATPEEIRSRLVEQVRQSVRWTDSIRWMAEQGVTTFVELGPGKVLTGLLKRTDATLIGCHIDSPDELKEFTQHVTQ